MFGFIKRERLSDEVRATIGTNTGVVVIGNVEGSINQQAAAASEPPSRWRSAKDNPSVFATLDWKARLTDPVGPKDQQNELVAWAKTGLPVRARLIWGEGGVGKTRLAAEVADELREAGWTAGFADLSQPSSFFVGEKGLLLILDYPEERRADVLALLRKLDALGESAVPIRLLLLSRREWDFWEDDVREAHAESVFDSQVIERLELGEDDAHDLYEQALDKLSAYHKAERPKVSRESFVQWFQRTPRSKRPLFVLVAALHAVLNPSAQPFDVDDTKSFMSLAKGELIRLRAESKEHGLQPDGLARLAAFSVLGGAISADQLRAWAEPELEVGLPAPTKVVDIVRRTSLWRNGKVQPVKPDLLGACLATAVLKARGGEDDRAAEWLWQCLADSVDTSCEQLSRVIHDAEFVLLTGRVLSQLLATAVRGNPARCAKFESVVSADNLPMGLVLLSVEVYRTLADAAADDVQRAGHLNDLAISLADSGDNPGALPVAREAAESFRRLAEAEPARFLPYLAMSLSNLSTRLADSGDKPGALPGALEAAETFRRLAEAEPARFLPYLATSLSNLSNRLADSGDNPGALPVAREAAETCRRLAEAEPARFLHDLAMSLSNLSNRLADSGDNPGALPVALEAAETCRRLAEAEPARFLPDLAISLNNLALRLSGSGDNPGALPVAMEAVGIRRRLAEAEPARFLPDLAGSLNNLAVRLADSGDNPGALPVAREAAEIYRRLAEAEPARFGAHLASAERTLKKIEAAEE